MMMQEILKGFYLLLEPIKVVFRLNYIIAAASSEEWSAHCAR
jgi:hypothetical protein